MCSVLLFLAFGSMCRLLVNFSFALLKFQPKLKRTESAVLVQLWPDLVCYFMYISPFACLKESFTAWVESLEMGIMGWEWQWKWNEMGMKKKWKLGAFEGCFPGTCASFSSLNSVPFLARSAWCGGVAKNFCWVCSNWRNTGMRTTDWHHGTVLDFGF